MFYKTISLVFLFGFFSANAQQNDSIVKIDSTSHNLKFNYKQLIIPGVLIGYGVIGIGNDQLLSFNHQIQNEVTEDIDNKITIDDFSQYAPAASVYALNAFGVKGKNNMRDRSVILVTSYAIMATTVLGLKTLVHEERPTEAITTLFLLVTPLPLLWEPNFYGRNTKINRFGMELRVML